MRLSARRFPFLIGSAAILVTVGGWAAFRRQGGVEYRTAPVDKGDMVYAISTTGSPNALVTVQVGSQVSGNILALYADFNTRVTKGQLVARIDPQVFQARVNQSRANLEAARAAVANARAVLQKGQAGVASANADVADYRAQVLKAKVAVQDGKSKLGRRNELLQAGVISAEELDTAKATYDSAVAAEQAAEAEAQAAQQRVESAKAEMEVGRTQVDSAEAQVKQATAALEQAQLDLDHTFIRAPVDGVVVARHVDVGQTVAASLQAPTLFEIAQDLTKMEVHTNVSEADVGHVSVGQPASFTVDAYPQRTFHGRVSQIRQAPINVQNVITYDVVVAVSNQDLKLFPGMTANVKILADEHNDVLRVPNAALRFRPADAVVARNAARAGAGSRRGASGDSTVWVLDGSGTPRPAAVKLGLSDGAFTEIAGGSLSQGDRVILAAFTGKAGDAPSAPMQPGGRRGPGF